MSYEHNKHECSYYVPKCKLKIIPPGTTTLDGVRYPRYFYVIKNEKKIYVSEILEERHD